VAWVYFAAHPKRPRATRVITKIVRIKNTFIAVLPHDGAESASRSVSGHQRAFLSSVVPISVTQTVPSGLSFVLGPLTPT